MLDVGCWMLGGANKIIRYEKILYTYPRQSNGRADFPGPVIRGHTHITKTLDGAFRLRKISIKIAWTKTGAWQ